MESFDSSLEILLTSSNECDFGLNGKMEYSSHKGVGCSRNIQLNSNSTKTGQTGSITKICVGCSRDIQLNSNSTKLYCTECEITPNTTKMRDSVKHTHPPCPCSNYEHTLNASINKKTIFDPQIEKLRTNITSEENEKAMMNLLVEFPKLFYFVKDEYENYKKKYESTLKDFVGLTKVKEDMENRIQELVKTSQNQNEIIMEMKQENTMLKNKQAVLDSFKEESLGYMELIKEDSNKKGMEVEALLKETNQLNISNHKYTILISKQELELQRRKLEIEKLNERINAMEQQRREAEEEKERTVFSIGEIKQRFRKLDIFELDSIYKWKKKTQQMEDALLNEVKGKSQIITEQKKQIEDLFASMEELKLRSCMDRNRAKEVEDLLMKAQEVSKARAGAVGLEISLLVGRLKESAKSAAGQIELAKDATKIMNEKLRQKQDEIEDLKRKMSLKAMELEAQKTRANTRIQELEKKIEDQEDIWDVFK